MLSELLGDADVEQVIRDSLNVIHNKGPADPAIIEKLTHIKKNHNEIFLKYESQLMSLMGLFYKTEKPTSMLEEIYSIYSDSIIAETGKSFTPVQASAYKNIANQLYFSFSAPTSTGKSFMLREIIKDATGDIVIVVPSRALISEYYYEVTHLVGNDVLVLQFIEDVNRDRVTRRVFIVTPERGTEIFKYVDSFSVELFLLDEAQLSEEQVRGMKFDSFVRRSDRVFPTAKKVFAHPFVSNPEAQLIKHGFSESSSFMNYDFQTVGKIFISHKRGNFEYFSPNNPQAHKQLYENIAVDILSKGGTLLVYIAKSKIYDGRHLAEFGEYIDLCPKLKDDSALKTIDKLRKFIGAGGTTSDKHSLMLDMMERGVVIHHGSMPLKARLLVEEFVKANHARICFATSTLNQGINMPFDLVWIDNFRNMTTLTLKNLIGRSGRSTLNKNSFDYGYTIIKYENVPTFITRFNAIVRLGETSPLDEVLENVDEDERDIVEAIQDDCFDDEMNLPDNQVERIKNSNINSEIQFILNNVIDSEGPITGKAYYGMAKNRRDKVKKSFKTVYVKHLRRTKLTRAEASTLSASIPIMLWQIQGKSFSEIVSLRHAFLSEKDKRNAILKRMKKSEISKKKAKRLISQIEIRFSQIPASLPNKRHRHVSLYPENTSVDYLDFDTIVYDTYDYLDKVISLSLVDPICAALQIFYETEGDTRAISLKNYLRFGTDDDKEIWLLKYGFSFEDIDWLKGHVEHVDESRIAFKVSISEINEEQKDVVQRYL